MAEFAVAQDPLGFGRLTEQLNVNRKFGIDERDANLRSKLLGLQISGEEGKEQSRLGKIANEQKLETGLSHALSNIPDGGNRFTAAHSFLTSSGFNKEAEELVNQKLSQLEKVEKIDKKAADVDFNNTVGKVLGLTAEVAGNIDEVNLKSEAGLRKEFTKLSGEFLKTRDAISRVRAAGTDPSAAGDLALIFNYMKVLDPGSTVREGEFATAQNAAGVEGRIISAYNRVVNGERLNKEQRADFMDRAERLFEPISTSHSKTKEEFKRIATLSGLRPDAIIVDFTPEEEEKALSADEAGQAEADQAAITQPTEGFKIVGVRAQ